MSPDGDPDGERLAALLNAARPQAVAALLRRLRDLDAAEEAFQEACVRAPRAWPRTGPPRDPAAWLILVGRNARLDAVRRDRRMRPLPAKEAIAAPDDAEPDMADRIDAADYRDDVLRLLFICCHPDLTAPQQVALALRVVSGLSIAQIARAFLVGEAAMEQRITRAKRRVAAADVAFETPGPAERRERLAAVAAMVYLVFNEGYTAGVAESGARAPLCEEAIRLGRLLLRLFPAEREAMGLLALMLLQHSRAAARFDADGGAILLDDHDRSLWDRRMIDEGLALVDRAMRLGRPGGYQLQAAIAAQHARAARSDLTDWARIEFLYAALEALEPSPVVTLNRAAAAFKARGPAAALAMIEPLSARLSDYVYFHGARGAFLQKLGRAAEARAAFERAVSLARSPAEAAHLRDRLGRLAGSTAA